MSESPLPSYERAPYGRHRRYVGGSLADLLVPDMKANVLVFKENLVALEIHIHPRRRSRDRPTRAQDLRLVRERLYIGAGYGAILYRGARRFQEATRARQDRNCFA